MQDKNRINMIQGVSFTLFILGLIATTCLTETHSAWTFLAEAIGLTVVPPFLWAGTWALIDTIKGR